MEKKKISIILGTIIAIVVGFVLFKIQSQRKGSGGSVIDITKKFEPDNFLRAIDVKGDVFAKCDGQLLGGIVPHHLIGGEFISDIFRSVKDVDTVIIIGPNHFEKGESSIITSSSDWLTAKGKVDADAVLVKLMLDGNIAKSQDNIIGNDHSIGNIMPFVAYYFPNAKVVPIILKRDAYDDKFERLLQNIFEQQKTKKILIIGSIDFSHYLPAKKSEMMDRETIEAILANDYATIKTFRNENMDSPPSVIAMLKVMKLIGYENLLWRNSNSFEVLGGDINSTTSYFEIAFCK